MTSSIIQRLTQTINDKLLPAKRNATMQQAAHEWQRTPKPSLPDNLAALPGYQKGQYARLYTRQLEQAISAALSPTLPSPKQSTAPLPARDIVRGNTEPRIEASEIYDVPTGKLPPTINPVTPLPETRAELFQDVPDMAESLILWPEEEDEDITEIRERKTTTPRIATTTMEIPNMDAEEILLTIARGATHEQGTGEQEPVREKHWML